MTMIRLSTHCKTEFFSSRAYASLPNFKTNPLHRSLFNLLPFILNTLLPEPALVFTFLVHEICIVSWLIWDDMHQCSFISDLFWMLLPMYSWVVFWTELTWYNYNTIQYYHLFYCYTAPASFVVCQWWAVIRFLLVRCMLNKLARSWNRSGASGLYLSSYPCLLCSRVFSVWFFFFFGKFMFTSFFIYI
jgi:hypothetical protein